MLLTPCLLLFPTPAETANLQLSFNVVVASQICISACICSFL
ncbi:hypothetical protein [Methanimicrococcus hongohii]|nr:hypothetical protein [Methanimicrococcus sp. Hf6]